MTTSSEGPLVRRGVRFSSAEQGALARLHETGLTSLRYDGWPPGGVIDLVCSCRLVRDRCTARTPWEQACPAGERALAGRDHPDQWYRDGQLVAVVHYPYGMDSDSLHTATAGCAELGLQLDIDAQWAIHACDQWTLAVVISGRRSTRRKSGGYGWVGF